MLVYKQFRWVQHEEQLNALALGAMLLTAGINAQRSGCTGCMGGNLQRND
jgi:homoaconitase/3-isopropylmalate dehydratase large subunit